MLTVFLFCKFGNGLTFHNNSYNSVYNFPNSKGEKPDSSSLVHQSSPVIVYYPPQMAYFACQVQVRTFMCIDTSTCSTHN